MTCIYRLAKQLKRSSHLGIIRVQSRISNMTEADFSFVICHDQDRSNDGRMLATGMCHAGFCLRFAEPVFAISHSKLCD
jgi:hypothetical protein